MNAIPDTLPALLARYVNNAAPALVERGRMVSFRDLAGESRRVAQGLRQLGVRPGDRVALWLPNVTAWLATFFACAQLGAVAVAVNTRFRSHELADILQRSAARVLVFWPKFKGIDFDAILAACDAQALGNLEAVVVYAESGEPAPPAIRGRLHLVMEGGQPGEIYELGDETSIGRTTGQITFPHDGFMSGRHARVVRRGGKFALSDEGSRNGTFVKIKGEIELEPGDMILVGKQLFRFEV